MPHPHRPYIRSASKILIISDIKVLMVRMVRIGRHIREKERSNEEGNVTQFSTRSGRPKGPEGVNGGARQYNRSLRYNRRTGRREGRLLRRGGPGAPPPGGDGRRRLGRHRHRNRAKQDGGGASRQPASARRRKRRARSRRARKLKAPAAEIAALAAGGKRLAAEIRYAQAAGLDPHRARIRLLQVYAGGDRALVIDLDHTGAGVLDLLDGVSVIAHNMRLRAGLPRAGRRRAGRTPLHPAGDAPDAGRKRDEPRRRRSERI